MKSSPLRYGSGSKISSGTTTSQPSQRRASRYASSERSLSQVAMAKTVVATQCMFCEGAETTRKMSHDSPFLIEELPAVRLNADLR